MIPQPRNSTNKPRYTAKITNQNKLTCLLNSSKKIQKNQDIPSQDIYSFSSFELQSEVDKDKSYSESNDYLNSYLMKNKYNSKLYIKKVIHLDKIHRHKEIEIEDEIKLLEKLNHKNIMKVYAYKRQFNIIEIIQDYASKGNLNDLLEKKIILNEVNAFYIFHQLLNGLSYLHSNKYILHGEMNTMNIKITQHGRIIIDTKLYQYIDQSKYNFYTLKEDFFALGVILARMTKGFNEDIPVSKECDDIINVLIGNKQINDSKDIYETKWMKKYLNDSHKVIISQFHEFASEKTNEFRIKLENDENKQSDTGYNNNKNKQRNSAFTSSSINSSYSYFLGTHRKLQSINNKKPELSVINS